MRLYRCLILDEKRNKLEDIYLEKNKKAFLNKLFKEERKLIKILEVQFERKIREKELEEMYFKIGRLLNAGLSLKKIYRISKK